MGAVRTKEALVFVCPLKRRLMCFDTSKSPFRFWPLPHLPHLFPLTFNSEEEINRANNAIKQDEGLEQRIKYAW